MTAMNFVRLKGKFRARRGETRLRIELDRPYETHEYATLADEPQGLGIVSSAGRYAEGQEVTIKRVMLSRASLIAHEIA